MIQLCTTTVDQVGAAACRVLFVALDVCRVVDHGGVSFVVVFFSPVINFFICKKMCVEVLVATDHNFFFVKRHLFESQIRKFFLRGCYGYVLLAAATVSVAFDMLLSPLPLRVEF